jgi:hypothetical protein
MSPDGIVEAVDIASDFGGRFSPAPEDSAPDEFGLQRLEERLDQALSKQFPFPDIEITMPFFLSSA